MIKRLVDLMVGVSNHGVVEPRQSDRVLPRAQNEVSRKVAPDCAIWNDIARALEFKAGTGK
jgi:hypothetical protein